MSNLTWTRDDGYSGEETARRGDFAAVICPPYFDATGRWGYQIFDEADEDALECGKYYTDGYNLPSKDAAKRVAAAILEELDAARI